MTHSMLTGHLKWSENQTGNRPPDRVNSSEASREALKTGIALMRATAYMSAKSGRVYLLEMKVSPETREVSVTTCLLNWDSENGTVLFGEPKPLDPDLREGWLFDLFDRSEGLVVAPPGVHFRKSSNKHTDKFLRGANALTSSSACGLLAMFALGTLAPRTPKRILVDTAPLISLANAMMRIARVQGIWEAYVPARSFSSYDGQAKLRRLSINDVILISATTSGSLAESLVAQQANIDSIVTLFYLSSKESARPKNVLCDLTATAERGFGYQSVENYAALNCRLCRSEFILAELEGDQFLLQQRQHRLLKFVQTTQSADARVTLTELHQSQAAEVVMRADATLPTSIEINEERLLECPDVRKDFIRQLRRYTPHPLGLVVRVNIAEDLLRILTKEAGIETAVASAKFVDWPEVVSQPVLEEGQGVLVAFGCLSSHIVARQINASLRSKINNGNVTYVSALTLAETPQQYLDLKMFLGYGERGSDTFTYRDSRRLALPGRSTEKNPWVEELDLLNDLTAKQVANFDHRREFLASVSTARDEIFWPGLKGPLAIQRDFVYLDTSTGIKLISQADVFTVVSNLYAAARAGSSDLTKKPTGSDAIALTQSVYGHVLLSPETFMTFNDGILKASLLRAARKSELIYDVDPGYSLRMSEILMAELLGWSVGTGDALPEMLLALATGRLQLRDSDRATIRRIALTKDLPLELLALAKAIPHG